MKKDIKKINIRFVVAIGVMIVFLVLLLFPVKAYLDDGGTVIYQSLFDIYEVRKIKTFGNVGMTLTMKEGWRIELFGKEIYYNIDKEYPVEQKDWRDSNGEREDVWMLYTKTPYSSLALVDGAGTAKHSLAKTLENYPIDLSADEILEKAKGDICVVSEDSRVTSGGEYWETFLEQVAEEKNAQIRLVKYCTLGEKSPYAPEFYELIKDKYPKVDFYSLVYVAGEGFWLGCRSNRKEEAETVRHYKYLKHFGGDTAAADSVDSHYDHYVLVDDDTVTWKTIMEQMLKSVRTEDDIVWREVYCNYIE